MALDLSADAQDFRLDRRYGRCYGGCLHCFQNKGGLVPAFDTTASDP
jgi:hypothetical protein